MSGADKNSPEDVLERERRAFVDDLEIQEALLKEEFSPNSPPPRRVASVAIFLLSLLAATALIFGMRTYFTNVMRGHERSNMLAQKFFIETSISAYTRANSGRCPSINGKVNFTRLIESGHLPQNIQVDFSLFYLDDKCSLSVRGLP